MFLFYIVFYLSILGKIPLDVGDDIPRISEAAHASSVNLMKQFFLNWKLSNLYASDAFESRIGETIILKFLHFLFGEKTFFYYLYQIFIGALCAALLTYLAEVISGSALVGLLSGVWYMLMPSTYVINTWLADFAEHTHLLILVMICLTIFIQNKYRFGRLNLIKGTFFVALIMALLYVAIRIKANAYIYPITIAAVSFPFFIKNMSSRHKALILGGILLLFVFLPWEALRQLHFDPQNAFNLIIQNRSPNEFEMEKTVALFDLSSVVPVSVLRGLGAFVAWLAIFSCVLLVVRRVKPQRFAVRLFLAWLLSSLAVCFFIRNDARYMSEIMLPLILILGVLFKTTYEVIQGLVFKKIYVVLVISGLFWVFINNIQHVAFIRNWKSEEWMTRYVPVSVICSDFVKPSLYKDMKSEKSLDAFDLMAHFWDYNQLVMSYCDVGGAMKVEPYSANRDALAIQRYGRAYWVTQRKVNPPKDYQLISTQDVVVSAPLTDFLSSLKKKKRSGSVSIYRKLKTNPPIS